MYESPIRLIETATKTIMEQKENTIVAKVQSALDVQVDKGELLRALQYDRGQYDKGYADGKAEATPKWIPVTERLPEGLHRVLAYVKEDRYDRYAFAIYENEKWWDCFYIHPVNVTHWVEMPEPPEGE